MSVHTSIAVPARERRRWPYVAAAVLVIVAIVAAVLAITLGTGTSKTESGATTRPSPPGADVHQAGSTLMSLTPAEIANGALGGYMLPAAEGSANMAQVLASMSPETRRYTERIMRLTFAQLAAGAAGSP